MNYIFIDSKTELRSYLSNLTANKCSILALDTEANMHRYAYGVQLCLIQVFDGKYSVIIDPFKIDNGTLKILFENRDILKVMYDAASDMFLLKNGNNIDIKSILDLRPGIELLNYDKKDLYSVIATELGVLLEGKKKYHRYNWLRRPISKEALEYSINDVRYLIQLKDIVLKKLYMKNLFDSFILQNLRIQNRDYLDNPRDGYKKVKGFSGLKYEERTLFQKLFMLRDQYAKKLNMPSHNIISNNTLLHITKSAGAINEIRFPKRFSPKLRGEINQALRNILEAV